MFLGIVLSYHGEPSLTLAVTACRILLIPACLIPNLIPACTLHPNCLSPPSPYKPSSSRLPFTLAFPFSLHPIAWPSITPFSLPFHPTPYHSFSAFTLHPVCPFHLYATISSLAFNEYTTHLTSYLFHLYLSSDTLQNPPFLTLINTHYTPNMSSNWF